MPPPRGEGLWVQSVSSLEEALDTISQMLCCDVMICALNPEPVSSEEDVGVTKSFRGLELVAGQLDLQAIWIPQVDGVHEATVTLEELDALGSQTVGNLKESGTRDVEGDVLDTADVPRCRSTGILKGFIREDGQQAPVAWIEVEVVFVGLA